MSEEAIEQALATKTSRRSFLYGLGAASASAGLLPQRQVTRRARATVTTPLQNIIVACQENRSFDHYFGYYPGVGSFGVPANFSQPNGTGGRVRPYHLGASITSDPTHEWPNIHGEWDNGKMDGFYTTDGKIAMGYYNANDLSYYYSLAQSFTLCGNFFCSLLGPTFPNRISLLAGTAGGNTSNNIADGSLNFPILLDLLDNFGITWKIYNGALAQTAGFNPATFFSKWQNDPRVNVDDNVYNSDLANGTLPQFSFIASNVIDCEHPPASIQWGQSYMSSYISALMASFYWAKSAFILTYDEAGGWFDHVPPPQFDAYGAGIRVPTLVVSPYARHGYISPTTYDHSSILKLVEAVFNLPTVASINHQFDQQTPGQNNAAANGQPYGPPAPPRDGLPSTSTGNMLDVFNFAQSPTYRPTLPQVVSTDHLSAAQQRQMALAIAADERHE